MEIPPSCKSRSSPLYPEPHDWFIETMDLSVVRFIESDPHPDLVGIGGDHSHCNEGRHGGSHDFR